MREVNVVLHFKHVFLTCAELVDGTDYDITDPELRELRLEGTENFTKSELNNYTQKNLQVNFDGVLNNQQHYHGLSLSKIVGPANVCYNKNGMELTGVSLYLEIETNEMPDNLDIDDLCNIVLFQINDKEKVFSFIDYHHCHSKLLQSVS